MSDLVQEIGQFLMEHCTLPDSVMVISHFQNLTLFCSN